MYLDIPLLEEQNTRKLSGTKNNCVQVRWGKFWTQKIQRDQKTQLPLLRSQEKNRAKAATEHALCTQHLTRGWATHLSCPSAQPLDTSLSSPLIRNKLAPPWGVSKQGNLLSVFIAPSWSRGLHKTLPEFLFWPLVNFYGLGKAKNPGG